MKKGFLAGLLGSSDKKGGGVAQTAIAAGAGAAGTYGFNLLAVRVGAMRSRWWAAPAAMVATGHFLKRVSPAAGFALIGAGACVGAINRMSAFSQASGYSDQGTQAGDEAGSAADEAGALLTAGDEAGAAGDALYDYAGDEAGMLIG